jgi:hypothetical protein
MRAEAPEVTEEKLFTRFCRQYGEEFRSLTNAFDEAVQREN